MGRTQPLPVLGSLRPGTLPLSNLVEHPRPECPLPFTCVHRAWGPPPRVLRAGWRPQATNPSPENCRQLLMPQGEGVDPFGFQWNV